MTKVLVLSYHYPPCAYGCCIRAVNFVKFLPQFGFKPVVLTVEPEYYKDRSAEDNSHQSGMPADIEVIRTSSLEPKTKIGADSTSTNPTDKPSWPAKIKDGIFNSLRWLGESLLIPDVQILWAPMAINSGRKLLASPDIKLIYAVAPHFSVLLIGYWLKKFTKKPLVLDFKDMWVGCNFHEHRNKLCSLLSKPLEKMVVKAADRVILTTDYGYRQFVDRYPRHKSKFLVISNGYDPQIEELVKNSPPKSNSKPGLFKIIHAGTVETHRNPEGFISAVKELKDEYPEFAAGSKICLSGKVDHKYIDMVKELGLEDMFTFKGYLNYNQNIEFLNSASLLLLLTSHDAPYAVPGKLYEYFALKKPILSITEDGASKDLLLSLGIEEVVHPKDMAGIKRILWKLYQDFSKGKLTAPEIQLERFNRKYQTKELAQVFSQVIA